MAVVDPSFPKKPDERKVLTILWEGLTGADTGKPFFIGGYTDLSVQLGAYGGNTHGSSTTVLQGSNDPAANPNDANHASAVWFTLNTPSDTAISRTTTEFFGQVLESPLWIRPSQTGGTAGDLDVIVKAVRND